MIFNSSYIHVNPIFSMFYAFQNADSTDRELLQTRLFTKCIILLLKLNHTMELEITMTMKENDDQCYLRNVLGFFIDRKINDVSQRCANTN